MSHKARVKSHVIAESVDFLRDRNGQSTMELTVIDF